MSRIHPFAVLCAPILTATLFLPVFANAQTVFVLPEAVPTPKTPQKVPVEGEPLMIPMPSVRLSIGLVDLPDVRGTDLERPQALTVLRHRHADELPPPTVTTPETGSDEKNPEQPATATPTSMPAPDRTEHLSTVEEASFYDAPGWTTEVALPHAGVYQFILETKPTWTPQQSKFIQHSVKTLHSGQDETSFWERSAGLDFEIVPQTRPFGLCAGMSFTGTVLRQTVPVSDTPVEVVWLPQDNPAQRKKTGKPPFTPVQQVRTSSNGDFTVTLPWAGWWGFSAVEPGGDPLRDPEGKMRPTDHKTTLWVPIVTCTPGVAR